MIKITNAQASTFLSPAINQLVNDKDRKFPISAAFQISDMVMQIHQKAKLYQDHAKQIIEKNGGVIGEQGQVSYSSKSDGIKASKEMDELNSVSIELVGDKITWSEDWPALTLYEAFLLRPIVDMNGGKNAESNGESPKENS